MPDALHGPGIVSRIRQFVSAQGLSLVMMSRLIGAMSRCRRASGGVFAAAGSVGGASCLLAAALALCLPAGRAGAATVPREVYLVQNSGWMEPFYLDPHSPFMPLLHAFIAASALPGAVVTIASFNQAGQLGDLPSPLPLFSGALTEAALNETLARIGLPRRSDGKYTDADYNGALSDAISKLLSRDPGVIWMVTNNKNSRSNDQHVVENTNRFSTLLAGSDAISSIVAYPIRLPAQGPTFSEKGLVIYGIAYGADAASWLDQATKGAAMQQLLVAKPVRLKPLERDPVTLTLTGTGSGGLHFGSADRGIVVDGLAGGAASSIDIPGRLTSSYYPQVIEQAHLRAEWVSESGGPMVSAVITPDAIGGMGPDETLDGVHVVLNVAPVARAPGLAGLLEGRRQVHGLLRLQLTDVRLGLQQGFVDKMHDLFDTNADAVAKQMGGGRQATLPSALPAVFLGHEAVAAAATDIAVTFGVVFSPWPLVLLVAGAALVLLVLLVLLGLLLACLRERTYSVPVGPDTMSVSVRPFRSTTLRSRGGTRVTVTGRLMGRPKVVTIV